MLLKGEEITICVFIWFSIACRVILYHGSVDAVAQLFVHVNSNLIGDSDKEINKEHSFPACMEKRKHTQQLSFALKGVLASPDVTVTAAEHFPVLHTQPF